ncbi:MAG: chemotaxis protein CheD [Neptuniibacter sp.]
MNLSKGMLPSALRGFEGFKPFWEPRWSKYAVKVAPGEFYVSNSDMVITTVLGSCISVCIHDPVKKLGGLNHFMLPNSGSNDDLSRSMRYGFFAMEQLINELMKYGCRRESLQIKLTGGGEMIRSAINQIGQQNIDFILQYLKDEGLNFIASDLGGNRARKVAYFPLEGRMLVNKLDHREDQRLIEEERTFRVDVDSHLDDTDVELF